MDFKFNKMRGMSTIEEDRKIADDVSREVQNLTPEVGQDVIRHGFTKINDTKYSGAVRGLFDYQSRYHISTPVVTYGGVIYSNVGEYYDLDCTDPIEVDSTFTLTIVKYTVWGDRDYGYNGTADITENGDGSLNTSTLTFTQGRATTSAIIYTGGSAGSLTITATDQTSSQLYGTVTVTVALNPFSLAYTLSGRSNHYLHSRTTSGGTSIYDSKIWFASGEIDFGVIEDDAVHHVDIVSIDSGDSAAIEATLEETNLYLGMCITNLNGDLYVGTGTTGSLWKSTDGTNFSDVDTLGTVIYCLYAHGGKYYAGTGYGGIIYESSDLSSWNQSHVTGDIACTRMITFDGKLYAGTSSGWAVFGGDYGVFKLDGSWSQTYTGSLTQIFGMEVLGSYMYIGEHDEGSATGGIVRRTTDGTNFSTVLDTGQDFPYCMCVAGSTLYVGCADGLIYYTTDGTTWSNKTSPTDQDIIALSYFNSKLFATTQNYIYIFAP